MTSHYQAEIIAAVLAAAGPNDSLISRQRIEDEIEENPRQYSSLAEKSRKGRRQIITKAMNEIFISWYETRGVKPSSFVWQIRDQAGNIPGTGGGKHDHC